ncbi:MAG TPA: glyoxylate/hydroxypyruvate reductase A [Roseiarcus sp.]|nr:glyoxylate/hydroxypyruvate reductase A [Roseiarcus sp.]
MTILLAIQPERAAAPWEERLRELLPGRSFTTTRKLVDRREIDYALSWRHPAGALAGLPNLKAIFSLGAGVDHLFADPQLPDAPIVRVVDKDLVNRMSEWVVLHALLHLRQQRLYDRRQAERHWEEDLAQPAARDLRVGVLGLGVLGRDAARKLKMLGFRVAGWSRTLRRLEGIRCFCGADGLDLMLAQTDILVALLPLTEATRGMLGAHLFAKLARDGRLGGPILINAGRGALHVEKDVVEALDSGVLKAASLDVFEREPLPPHSPLWRARNVFVTPHCAALAEPGAVSRFIARQIRTFEGGGRLKNVVDRSRGY